MRHPAGKLIGRIRVKRTQNKGFRIGQCKDQIDQAQNLLQAQRVEIFSEDSKLLRAILITVTLLSLVYWFQANERIRAVRLLADAEGSIALEAALSTKLQSPVDMIGDWRLSDTEKAELSPARNGEMELLVDSFAQAKAILQAHGMPAYTKVTLYSPFLGRVVEANLTEVARPPSLTEDVEYDNTASLNIIDRQPIISRSRALQHMALIEERCPSKWLNAQLSYRVIDRSSNGPTRGAREASGRLSMGGGTTWMLSNFQVVTERGHRLPLVSDISEPGFRLYFFRAAEPSVVDIELDCTNYVLRWGFEFAGSTNPRLIQADDEGHLTNEFRERFEGAKRQISKLSVRLADGIDAGVDGVFILIPIVMLFLSIWLSIVLRRLASDMDGQIQQLLLVHISSRRRTVFDGPHMLYLERAVRIFSIAYPIVALPVIVFTIPIIYYYPGANEVYETLMGNDAALKADVLKSIAKAAVHTPLWYLAIALSIHSAHQLLLAFGRPKHGSRRNRAQDTMTNSAESSETTPK